MDMEQAKWEGSCLYNSGDARSGRYLKMQPSIRYKEALFLLSFRIFVITTPERPLLSSPLHRAHITQKPSYYKKHYQSSTCAQAPSQPSSWPSPPQPPPQTPPSKTKPSTQPIPPTTTKPPSCSSPTTPSSPTSPTPPSPTVSSSTKPNC
ncbi:uncharacterized protein BO80DRAFT_467525 [Aspergillus ibericus CBS 121593]|uniref:Uncharacterized protein n=1 Tax=Aspergillus ibericus CBS 121593 TaxID=1448316 RepID=A0A395GSI9_9EURO|nr:hypothetical protein BO80DRAFT_467525 [Aspergillus ibericus CBS 121593]RAK97667.1 hypothetical protein BO80DRAFT_467525 [Aspergillus ibericus CBS 121593]